jgi:hypothetical protein
MTFRTVVSVTLVALAGMVAGCGSNRDNRPADSAGLPHKTADSAAGAIATSGAGRKTGATDTAAGKLPANHMGRIPVLEYHVIGGEKNELYRRTVASFKADLVDVY